MTTLDEFNRQGGVSIEQMDKMLGVMEQMLVTMGAEVQVRLDAQNAMQADQLKQTARELQGVSGLEGQQATASGNEPGLTMDDIMGMTAEQVAKNWKNVEIVLARNKFLSDGRGGSAGPGGPNR